MGCGSFQFFIEANSNPKRFTNRFHLFFHRFDSLSRILFSYLLEKGCLLKEQKIRRVSDLYENRFVPVKDEHRKQQPSRGVLRKGVLKLYSKIIGEHPCRCVISAVALQLY